MIQSHAHTNRNYGATRSKFNPEVKLKIKSVDNAQKLSYKQSNVIELDLETYDQKGRIKIDLMETSNDEKEKREKCEVKPICNSLNEHQNNHAQVIKPSNEEKESESTDVK